MYDFITDLDGYFCEKYANYDKLCVLDGYKMPTMQATRLDDFGRTYAYTLPANTMRLALQENKEELLKKLKEKMLDTTFSFSFQPVGFFARIRQSCSKYGFPKNFKLMLKKYSITEKEVFDGLSVSEEIWRNICKGKFLPSKNLLFSIALVAQFSLEDTVALLALLGEEINYANVKDMVIAYLLSRKVFNGGMIEAAFAEYKVRNLFLKA